MDKKIGFITMEFYEHRRPGSVGSSRIRGDWVVKNWPQAEKFNVGKDYQVLIFQKAYWLEMINAFQGIKIFDICDPDWLEPRPVVEMIDKCDAVVTSTEELAKYLRSFTTKPIVCIPDRLDLSWHTPREEHTGRARSVVWYGYKNNAYVLDKALDNFKRNHLKLTVISDQPYGYEDQYIPYDVTTVNEEIKKHDIVVLPHGDGERYKFKSNNKTIGAWALGMPVAHTGEDVDRFLSAKERNQEVALRLKEIKDLWDVKKSAQEYEKLVEKLMSERAKKA